MKTIKIYQVDAFTGQLFSGNPAAVCLLEQWLPDDLMQAIAAENNLAETAFLVPKENDFEIRWYTPSMEVDLCGHATLASAYVLFSCLNFSGPELVFHSKVSGILKVKRKGELLELNFPVDRLVKVENKYLEIEKCLGINPKIVFKGKEDYLAILEHEEEVTKLEPDLSCIAKLDSRGLIVSAPGEKFDFVSRYFAPQSGIPEDPVTGSAHTALLPAWSDLLNKNRFHAKQVSPRGGELFCELNGERCFIAGQASLYLSGEIFV
jgi:PhzF family phenazine biosynthesis protein